VLFWYGISLANAGRVDDAVARLREVYAIDDAWKDLPARLVAAGLLPDDAALVRRLESSK
jgi:hypothetical protein